MTHGNWTASEKKIARHVFDDAVRRELAEIMVEFKTKAAEARVPADMWDLRDHLTRVQHAFNAKYDYRYSVLIHVFGVLLAEGRIEEKDLAGISEDKIASMRTYAELLNEHWSTAGSGSTKQGR